MKTAVVVFAREPLAGKVKTRLARDIGTGPAARVYAALLDHALAQARATGSRVVLSLAEPCAPGSAWAPPSWAAVEPQSGEDLGARMANAFARRFGAGAEAVALVGSDIPLLSAELVSRALEGCRRSSVVLVPARDGGYVLVAQRSPGVDLFSGVPWSSPDTLAATRERLETLGMEHAELDAMGDLDSLDDLRGFVAGRLLSAPLRHCFTDVLARLDSSRRVP